MKKSPLMKVALDFGPLLTFFAANAFFGIYVATAVFMAVLLAVIGVEYVIEGKVSPVLMITGAVVFVFGGLTLWLANDLFIKLKPTILFALFAAILLGGLASDRLLIKYVLGEAVQLDDAGWRGLTWRWVVFLIALAALNEIVRQNFSTNVWVAYRVWGVTPLFFLFSVAQIPFIARHQLTETKTPASGES